MSASELSLTEFQTVLQRHKANEAAYKERLREINLTRGKVADQLELLQQSYDKKLKALEQKLEGLRGQNDALVRQNALYKSEIDTYQARLLEKEKIIAALLSQRRDLPIVGSSEKSKSDKTDSLNANEEEGKSFKKQGPIFKQDYEQPPIAQKVKQGVPPIEREKPQAQIIIPKVQKPSERSDYNFQEIKKPRIPKNKTVPLPDAFICRPRPSPPQHAAPAQLPNTVQEDAKIYPQQQVVETQVKHHPPPPPPSKSKPRKNPPHRRFEAEPEVEAVDANSFFRNLGRSQEAAKNAVTLQQQEVQLPKVNHQEEQLQYVQQQVLQEEPVAETHIQAQEDSAFKVKEQKEQAEQPHVEQHLELQDTQTHHSTKQEHSSRQGQNSSHDVQEGQNNFLSHFNQHETEAENFYQPYSSKPKKKIRNVKRDQEDSIEQEVSGNEFFSQLSKAEGEPQHHLQIEESSIDHIDRDNSLLSNEQPYFAEEVVPKKAVKMPKKKVKRDRIMMMDPACFD